MSLAVISNSELRDRFVIRRAALYAIRESRRRVLLANPYFVPDRGHAPGPRAGGRPRGRRPPARPPEQRLPDPGPRRPRRVRPPPRGRGPDLAEPHVIHTKALVVDDAFVSIGSYNFDHRSLAYNLELVVNAVDRRMTADVVAMLAVHGRPAELTREGFARRSPFDRLLERLAYSLRQWL